MNIEPTQQRLREKGLSLILLAATLLLSGCGFHLRGQATLPFESLHVVGPPVFASQVARAVRAGSQTRITTNPKEAQVTLQILSELRERNILTLSSGGRVRELQLRYRVTYRLFDQNNKEYISTSEILLKRDLTYNDADVIAKEQEEGLLYRDMQNDAVQQLVRRLQAARIDS
jgi:LPS-assembly lipoprotein